MILEAKNIYKSYSQNGGKKLEILKGIDFTAEEKKITIIVGASGAGKSTFLHILSGLDNPDKGEVLINGTNIYSLSDDEQISKFRNKHIGFIFQFHHLLPEFTAIENVALPQLINGTDRESAMKNAAELLDLVGLSDRTGHKPSELSGGEQQRVAVARALINKPDIIFADEPTGNLDSKNSEILHNLFVDLNKKLGASFLIVTHNPNLVKLADEVYEMVDGKIFKKNYFTKSK